MDVNSNTGNIHQTNPKHISRLKKEMYDHRLRHNPFSSPPSSTGSHDTVSTTDEELTRNLSTFSFTPDGEGTRKFSDDQSLPKRNTARSGRFGPRQTTVLNTSAIARAFPEWSGLVGKDTFTFSQSINTAALALTTPAIVIDEGKENVPPPAEHTQDNTFEDGLDLKKRRRHTADMQPRVENESDCSTVLSRTPNRPAIGSRRSRFSSAHNDALVSSPEPPKRSLQEIVSKIRTEKQTTRSQGSYRDMTVKQSPPRDVMHLQPPTITADKSGISPTGRSFFLPAFRHLPDWTSGTLKFSTMRNGVPLFVKQGKPGVQLGKPEDHGAVNGVDIPEEDELIFVSMDKLQEEVRELHDHDAMLQREAEKLQREVNQLQSELKTFKLRKRSDSAIGSSDSDGSFNKRGEALNQELEDHIAQLQDRLDHASRQVGVHDIHSSALAAERDEALHQAAVARERAQKLQSELEGTQKDLESTLQFRHEKEALERENATLTAANKNLKQQHDTALQNNKNITARYDELRREFATLHKELAAARDELASVRKLYEAAKEDKRLIAQDHASMERNNDTYFKENKRLQAQVSARDLHIADLKKGISSRDKMIDNIQGLTTDTAIIELNSKLEAEIERLKTLLQQQTGGLQEQEGSISAKEGRIRVLKEQNLELAAEKEKLIEENQRLRDEYEEMRGQWIDDRHKVIRLNQLITKNNTEYLRTLNDNTEDCVRLEEEFKQKEATLRLKLDRREAAIQKVKQLTNRITEITERDILGKPTKVTRIVEPEDATGGRYAASDLTGKSSAGNVEDDPELHLTQGSDFVSIMDGEIVKLKQTYRELQNQPQDDTEVGPSGNTGQITEYDLPSLSAAAPAMQRSRSDGSIPAPGAAGGTQPKGQPAGILKKSSQFALDEDTGRFSVKSALSIVSHHTDLSEHTGLTAQSHRSAKSMSNVLGKATRPESRLRRNSDTTHGGLEPTMTGQNMTSAFFVPDITLHSDKQSTVRQEIPTLSKEARRVLDGICKHKSDNCNLCLRIAAYGEKHSTTTTTKVVLVTIDDVKKGKKTVCVGKPVPVSDRMPEADGKNDEPTIRPATSPGEALAILIKETRDEIEHLQMELKRLNDSYFSLDKSLGQRERRRTMAEIQRLQAEVEMKSGQLYRLYDVLEGQKQAGQLMADDELDVTVLSNLVRVDATGESRDGSWNGFD